MLGVTTGPDLLKTQADPQGPSLVALTRLAKKKEIGIHKQQCGHNKEGKPTPLKLLQPNNNNNKKPLRWVFRVGTVMHWVMLTSEMVGLEFMT
jgi:hypothetical protein